MEKAAYLRGFEAQLKKRTIDLEPAALMRCGLYFYLLHVKNQSLNLTRLDSVKDAVDFHLSDALALKQALAQEGIMSLIDVGSGAGVPGVLMKCLLPDIRLCVLDSVKKKMDFVESAFFEMGLSESAAVSARAEEAGHDCAHREKYDCASARALGSQPYCLELCAPFVRIGGVIALLRSDDDALLDPQQYRETLGCIRENTHEYLLLGREKAFRVEIYRKIGATSVKFPRKPVQIKKRPL